MKSQIINALDNLKFKTILFKILQRKEKKTNFLFRKIFVQRQFEVTSGDENVYLEIWWNQTNEQIVVNQNIDRVQMTRRSKISRRPRRVTKHNVNKWNHWFNQISSLRTLSNMQGKIANRLCIEIEEIPAKWNHRTSPFFFNNKRLRQ